MPNFDWSDPDHIKQLLGLATGDAAMDADELDRLATWFREKWKHGPCPVCTETAWIPNPKIAHLPNEATTTDGSVFPVVIIFCGNCGYTLMVNARLAQVRLDSDTSDEEPKQQGVGGEGT